jgi:hypothetical protein
VFLSIATTRQGAKDLGFLLYKHPDRVFRSDASRNAKMSAVGFYPEATDERCEFCLVVEVDPVERVRGASWGAGIAQYVEPLPFLASSYMAQALSLCLRSAMNGVVTSKDPAEEERLKVAAAEKWPLEITVSPLRTSPALISRMFEPLGWDVALHSIALDIPGMMSGDRGTDLHTLTLRGEVTPLLLWRKRSPEASGQVAELAGAASGPRTHRRALSLQEPGAARDRPAAVRDG